MTTRAPAQPALTADRDYSVTGTDDPAGGGNRVSGCARSHPVTLCLDRHGGLSAFHAQSTSCLLGSQNQARPSRSHYRAGTLAGRSPSISSRGFRGQGVEREGRSGRPPTGANGIYDLTCIEVAGSAGDGDLATSAAGSPISSPRRSTSLAGTPPWGTRRATPPLQRRFCDRRPELLPPTTAGRPRHRHRIPLRPEEVQSSPGVRPGAAGPTEWQAGRHAEHDLGARRIGVSNRRVHRQ